MRFVVINFYSKFVILVCIVLIVGIILLLHLHLCCSSLQLTMVCLLQIKAEQNILGKS